MEYVNESLETSIAIDALRAAVRIIEQGIGAGMPIEAYMKLEACIYAASNATQAARRINRREDARKR